MLVPSTKLHAVALKKSICWLSWDDCFQRLLEFVPDRTQSASRSLTYNCGCFLKHIENMPGILTVVLAVLDVFECARLQILIGLQQFSHESVVFHSHCSESLSYNEWFIDFRWVNIDLNYKHSIKYVSCLLKSIQQQGSVVFISMQWTS